MRRRDELIVGFTIIIALTALFAGALWLSQTQLSRAPNFRTARFRTVGGLGAGNPVVLRGVRVGRVQEIRLGEEEWVEAVLQIYEDVQFPEDAAVIAASASLFGEWQVEIVSRNAPRDDPNVRAALDEAYDPESDVWPGATLPDIGQLTAQAGRIATDIATVSSRVQAAFDSAAVVHLQGAIEDFGSVTDRINEFAVEQTDAMGEVGERVVDVTNLLTSTARTLQTTVSRVDSATNQGELDEIVENTRLVASDLREAAQLFRELIAVIHDNQMSLQRIIQGADTMVARAGEGSGTMGRLLNDSTLYLETTLAIQELRLLVEDIKANPRRYFKFSVF